MEEEDYENLDRIVKDMKEQIDYEEADETIISRFDECSWSTQDGIILSVNDAKALVEYYEKTKGYERGRP